MNKQKKIPIQAIRLSVTTLVIIAIVLFKSIMSNKVEERIDTVLKDLPNQMVIYDDISVDIFGFSTHIYDISINVPGQEPITIDEIVINSIDQDHNIPRYLDLEINGIENNTNALMLNPQSALFAKNLGVEKLSSNIALKYNYKQDKKSLELDELSFTTNGVAEIEFEAEFHNISSFEAVIKQFATEAKYITVAEASLEFDDMSLTNAILKTIAQDSKKTLTEVKAQLTAQLTKERDRNAKRGHTAVVEIQEAMISFIKDPQSFDMSVEPKEPVSFKKIMRMRTQKEFVQALNFKVSAN